MWMKNFFYFCWFFILFYLLQIYINSFRIIILFSKILSNISRNVGFNKFNVVNLSLFLRQSLKLVPSFPFGFSFWVKESRLFYFIKLLMDLFTCVAISNSGLFEVSIYFELGVIAKFINISFNFFSC